MLESFIGKFIALLSTRAIKHWAIDRVGEADVEAVLCFKNPLLSSSLSVAFLVIRKGDLLSNSWVQALLIVVDQMDVVRRGVRRHPCKGSEESEFCQVFLYSSLLLSK